MPLSADDLQHDVKPSGCQCWRAEHLWKQFSAKFLGDVLLVFSIQWVGCSLQLPCTTLWWSSSSGLLARWPKSWSLRMCTSLEAAEQPDTSDPHICHMTSVRDAENFPQTPHVEGIYSVWELLVQCPGVTADSAVQQDRQNVDLVQTNLCTDRHWRLPYMVVKLCHAITSYGNASPDISVTHASISVLCTSNVDTKHSTSSSCALHTVSQKTRKLWNGI